MGNFHYDVLIVGAGVAGISCALVLGSALEKPYALNRKVGILLHHRNSHLNSALLNNAFGIAPGTNGRELLETSILHLEKLYPAVELIPKEKAKEIVSLSEFYLKMYQNERKLSKNIQKVPKSSQKRQISGRMSDRDCSDFDL